MVTSTDVGPVLENLLRGGGSLESHNSLVRSPQISIQLLIFIQNSREKGNDPTVCLAATLLQRAVRRCPADELPDVLMLLQALHTASVTGNSATATQLALSVAVLLIRSTQPPESLLTMLSTTLLATDGQRAGPARTALVSVVTLLAEELHAPAARISVAPQRLHALRSVLRRDGASLLSSLYTWATASSGEAQSTAASSTASSVGLLRCATAWCTAGLVSPQASMQSAMLCTVACQCLSSDDDVLASCAADALCAALAASQAGMDTETPQAGVEDGRGGDVSHRWAPLAAFATGLCDALSAHRLSRHLAAVACTSCSVLAHVLSLCQDAPTSSALSRWLEILQTAAVNLPPSEAGGARSCWVELHDVCHMSSPSSPAAVDSSCLAHLDQLLAQHRAALLHGVVCGAGMLPRDFGLLSLADREAAHEAREDCRALLRGAVFIGDTTVDAAVDAMRERAAALIEQTAAHLSQCAADSRVAPAPDELAASIGALEATLHALSAAAKPIGRRACAPLSQLLCSLSAPVAQLASSTSEARVSLARNLLCSMLILVGSLAAWLAEPGREREVQCVLPVVLASLGVPEEEPSGIWSLRSKQEHSGAVAMMKLCAAAPAAVLCASPLQQLLSTLHAHVSRPPGVLTGLSTRSSALLLIAASDLVSHVCAPPPSPAAVAEVTRDLLGPPLALLEQAARGGVEALPDASRAAVNLATILPRVPHALQRAVAELMAPWTPALTHMLGCSNDEAATAAGGALAALCTSCGAHAAPLVPALASAAWSIFHTRPSVTFAVADALCRCAAWAAVSTGSLETESAQASAAASELLVRIAEATATMPQPTSADAAVSQQSVLVRLFDLLSAWALLGGEAPAHASASPTTCAPGLVPLLTPSLPFALTALWHTTQRRPPDEALETQEGVSALKRGLLLLQRASSSSPVGRLILESLAGRSPTQTHNSSPPATELLRAILTGLSSWFPSWLLSDVVSALWALREVNTVDFASWLHLAHAAEGVPRPGLTAEQKVAFQRLVLDAKTKAAFKAAVKQACGGKKKATAGTPPVT